MKNMIENYFNGNLSDAKKQARRHSMQAIVEGCIEYGYTRTLAILIAGFLKGSVSFQYVCDHEAAEKAA